MSEEELREGSTLRIVTKCKTVEELAVRFAALVEKDSIFVVPPTPLAPGERRHLVVLLADGTVALAGHSEVADAHAQLGNRIGARLRFVDLDSTTRSSLDRMLAVKWRPDPAAPLPPRTASPRGTSPPPVDLTIRASPPPIAGALGLRAESRTSPPPIPPSRAITARGSTAEMPAVQPTTTEDSVAVPAPADAAPDDVPAVIHATVPVPDAPSIPAPVVPAPVVPAPATVETDANDETMPELRAIRSSDRRRLGLVTVGAALLGVAIGLALARIPESMLSTSAAVASQAAARAAAPPAIEIAPTVAAPGGTPTAAAERSRATVKKAKHKRSSASRHERRAKASRHRGDR